MANPVLDPPRPVLRLVGGSDVPDVPARDPRHRSAATLGSAARRIFRATLAFSLRERYSVNPDAVRVILAVRQLRHPGPANRFTTDDIWRLLMVDIVAWCRSRRLPYPEGCAHALAVMVLTLDVDEALDPESDSYLELAQAIAECTGEPDQPISRSSAPRWS